MTETPAGWYPDPEHANSQRHWDGSRWLDRFAPTPTALVATKGRRGWLIAGGIGAAVVVVAAALFILAQLGGSATGTVDHVRLETEIHDWAVQKEKADPSVKAQCPSDIPIKAGSTFHCFLSGGGQSVRVTVTIENHKGDVSWVVG